MKGNVLHLQYMVNVSLRGLSGLLETGDEERGRGEGLNGRAKDGRVVKGGTSSQYASL